LGSCYEAEFNWIGAADPQPVGAGFHYIDHLTHNVIRGNMDTWYKFYSEVFNFREIRFFDIAGKLTGLTSRALVGTEDIYASTDQIADMGMEFMPGPPPAYYARSTERVKDHEEPIERMKARTTALERVISRRFSRASRKTRSSAVF